MNKDNMNEYSLPFAAWELRLYLDTNPDDERALGEYRRLCASIGDKCSYACHTPDARMSGYESGAQGVNRGSGCGCGGGLGTSRQGGGNYGGNRCDSGNYNSGRCANDVCGCEDGGNVSSSCGSVWSWIDGPWPWEPEANGGDC